VLTLQTETEYHRIDRPTNFAFNFGLSQIISGYLGLFLVISGYFGLFRLFRLFRYLYLPKKLDDINISCNEPVMGYSTGATRGSKTNQV